MSLAPAMIHQPIRIHQAATLLQLQRALAGDRRLAGPLLNVVLQLPLNESQTAAILKAAGPLMTLEQFLLRTELHLALAPRVSAHVLLRAFKTALARPATTPLAASLEAVYEFVDLLPLVENRPSGRRNLREVLLELDVSPPLRAHVTKRSGILTLAEFFEYADDQRWTEDEFIELLEAFKRWLGTPPPPSNVIALPLAQPTAREVTDAMRATGIPDLGDWTVGMVEGHLSHSVANAKLAVLVQHGDWRALKQLLQRFLERLARLRAQPAPEVIRTREPALAALQDAALTERARLTATWPPGVMTAAVRLTFDAPDLHFEVRPTGGLYWQPTQVSALDFCAWPRAPKLECSCRAPACIHRVLVLEGLIGPWLHDPGTSAVLRDALKPSWVRVLDAIVAAPPPPRPKPGVLAFNLGPRRFHFSLHELGKRGPSTKGRRLDATQALPRLEGQDLHVAERLALAETSDDPEYSPHFGDALLLLEGHPRVRWEEEPEPSPVACAEGTVRIDETTTGFRLQFLVGGVTFDPEARLCPTTSGGTVVVLRGADRRILITRVSAPWLQLVEITRKVGPDLPREAAPRLVELLPSLEAGALVELPDDLRGEEREPVARPLVRVAASPSGLSLAVRVEPLEKGPVFVPGHGLPVSASFDGRRRAFTRRRFERELAEANALAGELGLDPQATSEPYTWLLDASDKHVETLRRLSGSGVMVEWLAPRVKFTREAKLDRLKLEITRKKDWFGLDGEVTIDDRRVSLAALLEAARARRRFVKLGDGDFAQLSEAMVEALAPLAHLSEPGALPELTLGAAPLLEALAPQLEALDAAKEWTELMARLTQAKTARFAVPRTLEATLRDYQVEGFEWLSRLAQWGVGACLADDMGLGKTLQALTLLVARAKQGPAVVVAPSSVLHNWLAEAAKFAPTLKLALFHEGARALGELGPMDVVVVSWTLLAREADAFSKVRFTTAVLDEAHAIKNADTLRAKAAHRLQADFLVAMSGTPIENHVGELWSLFRAVMPALLASEESFRRRFGSGQPDALAALALLVRPFVLRRTKAAVAKELPPRTELEVVIPLSAEERALYDDVRLSAMKELGEVTGESKRFDVLAALTRLRLTACHPRLVDEAWAGPTSKLGRLLELLESLASSGHRALVFSQFTKHLALVVEALRTQGVTFSYLDGQVPLAERQRRVEAFQRGEGGEVFLVSLKAGGTGLNLTAADYVIHLDPWWNPAVEDQASDRAHRIGQTRPVTVYRLIAEGTIEQGILSLHRDKRELVDALLSGTDTVGKLTTAQLAELIRST